jgi:hypothetical protein
MKKHRYSIVPAVPPPDRRWTARLLGEHLTPVHQITGWVVAREKALTHRGVSLSRQRLRPSHLIGLPA